MNLRILKKLSKRALPYLPQIGMSERAHVFLAERGDNYTKTLIRDRSCWERGASAHGDMIRKSDGEIKWLARNSRGRENYPWCYMWPPSHPLKGTPMIGSMCGCEEPEWDEETAWDYLKDWVRWGMVDCSGHIPKFPRNLTTPSEIFRKADEMLAAASSKKEAA